MASVIKLAVVLRKTQHGVSIADEHDSERIAAYCRELGAANGLSCHVVLPDARATLQSAGPWDGVLFVGADEFARAFLEENRTAPMFMWAKGYDLTIDARWTAALDRLALFFNSSYLSAVEDRYNDRTRYVPTAFHSPWPGSIKESIDDVRNRLVDVGRFDLVFSGSDRHVRKDCYRQRLLNALVDRGLAICVAAPRAVWNRPHQMESGREVALNSAIRILGNWGTERLLAGARCVLDLPWLDNVFPAHPSHHDPDRTIFALGWNIFRAGASGAYILTHDCAANRALGLDGENCSFYSRDITDLESLADEIVDKVRVASDGQRDQARTLVRRLFYDRHTYRHRWTEMCRHIGEWYRVAGRPPVPRVEFV